MQPGRCLVSDLLHQLLASLISLEAVCILIVKLDISLKLLQRNAALSYIIIMLSGHSVSAQLLYNCEAVGHAICQFAQRCPAVYMEVQTEFFCCRHPQHSNRPCGQHTQCGQSVLGAV